MAFSQLQNAISTLRISLAEIQNKERQLDSMIAQFRTQLRRLPRQVIYGKTSLDLSLTAMGEIDERLADAEANRRRLLAIKKTATEELQALELVKQVDEARRSLQEAKQRMGSSMRAPGEDEKTMGQIRQLEDFIAEHSKRAERAITQKYQDGLDL